MSLKDSVNNAYSSWMTGTGPDNDVVISSRVRAARNLSHFAFPHMLDDDKAQEVIHAVSLALENRGADCKPGKLEINNMIELSPEDRQILVDKHLISNDLLKDHGRKAVVLSEDEAISIMLNEEDHLRIQCILPGMQLESSWLQVNNIDDELEKTLDYAFSEKFGYLTACPTNVGTGLRCSVMVHLPALVFTEQIKKVLPSISKLGLTVRGLYGEGTEPVGNLFQISNQVTLGHSEEEIVQNLVSVTKQLLDQERTAREALYDDRKEYMEDKIGRSYGILKNSRIISFNEVMSRLSDLRLGIDLKIIKDVSPQLVNELIVLTRQAFLNKEAGKELSVFERDVKRANIIREKL
ncbi:MAG: protein arginine kinase [Clostridiales bacterium]|nr:protein arginine kinase [Clostridiales bacterium]MCF8023850.1 protein arginine kinase [Clostridiales bacterium]